MLVQNEISESEIPFFVLCWVLDLKYPILSLFAKKMVIITLQNSYQYSSEGKGAPWDVAISDENLITLREYYTTLLGTKLSSHNW